VAVGDRRPPHSIATVFNLRSYTTMGILAFLLLGLIAGAIAKAVMPGDDRGGILATMVLGVIGAVIGGFVAAALFDARPMDEFFDLSTWLCAIVGSIVVLAIYRAVAGRNDTTDRRVV
jgi:uncharacterized membrane protein YeaQ/YmgE (transglycosylase-associated protein family)